MAFNFGKFDEYGDSVTFADPIVEAVARAIELPPFKGAFYEAMGAPAFPIATKTFEVYNRTKTSRNGTIDAAWTNSATTGLGVADGALAGLTIGHILEIGDEVVIISGVDRSAGTISVLKRGAGGTTASAHTSGDAFTVIGFAGSDADLKSVESATESTIKWQNHVQTIFETIDWTKHGELLRKGMTSANAIAILIKEAEIRVAELLSIMAVRGVKESGTSGSNRYMSAGLIAQLNDVANRSARRYNVNGKLTEVNFRAALKDMFDNGGNADTIWCSPTVKSYINAFIGANSAVALVDSATNHTAGGIYVDSYNYEGKILGVKVDADMPDSKIAVVQQSKCKKGWLSDDGLRQIDEPQASSREKRKSLQGSVGFIIEDVGVDHTLLYGITGGETQRVYNINDVTPTES